MPIQIGFGLGITNNGGAPSLPAFGFQAETTAIASGFATPPTARRKKSIDRAIRYMKTSAPGLWAKLTGLWVVGPDEATFLVNWKTPGTHDLVKNGAPTYTANDGFTVAANTAYYDTGIALNSLSQNDWSVGVYSKTFNVISSCEFGAQDGSGNGITLNVRNATNHFVARIMAGVFTSVLTTPYSGEGWHGVTRTASNLTRIVHHGIQVETTTTASITPASGPNLRIGGASGNTNFSGQKLSAAYVTSTALTANEELVLHAAMRDYIERCQYGDIDIYEAGTSPKSVSADVIVYGTTAAAVIAAYEAMRKGHTVAMVGEPYVTTEWDIGGHPAAGLGSIDSNVPSAISGVFRQILKWINLSFYGRSDTTSQAGLSAEARAYRQAFRRMLDSTQTSATLPAFDVPVYFSTGIKSLSKTGTRISSITTNDGRTFFGRVFIGADYDGVMVPLAGIPYITGTEAAGASGESQNGFFNTAVTQPGISNNLNLDPYVTAGNSGSGLLPDIVAMPGTTNGNADASLESINLRIALSKDPTRQAPFDVSPPPNYNAQRYEILGRWYAAEATVRLSSSNALLKQDVLQGSLYDINNGSGGISTDVPQSGINYMNAANDAARAAVVSDVHDYDRGFFYWHLHSGDARIPANLLTDFQAYTLDPLSFLDPGQTGVLFWPNRAYLRDPVWQMQNTGFVLNGNDIVMGDGTTPRSTKTVAVASYAADRHAPRHVNSAGALRIQGGLFINATGGIDQKTPVPMEVIMPDAASCTNFLTPTTPSMTKIAWYMCRMEFTLGLMAQACGMIAAMAVEGNIDVQSVDYTTLRANLLADPDSVTPVLPQTN